MTNKITWRVQPAPTGQYRSFQKRCWPVATINDKPVASILCDDAYVPSHARTGEHAPLTVSLAFAHEHTFRWRRMKAQPATLDEAKLLVAHAVERYAAELYACR